MVATQLIPQHHNKPKPHCPYVNQSMSFANVSTPAKEISLAVITAISGSLSFAGSTTIVLMIVKAATRKPMPLKHRLLLGLSLNDMLQSAVYMFWNFQVPEGTPGVYGARGNEATCNFQGVMISITGESASFYNAALSAYYWLTICHNKSEAEISAKYEKRTHVIAVVYPTVVSLASMFLGLYTVTCIGCWMGPTPFLCTRDPDIECERGRYAHAVAWVIIGGPVLVLGGFICHQMYAIYQHVKMTTMAVGRYNFENQVNSRNLSHEDPSLSASRNLASADRSQMSLSSLEKIRDTGLQAFLYVAAYMVCHASVFVTTNVEVVGYANPFWLLVVQNVLYPIQGLLNVMIFLRPEINAIRKRDSAVSFWRAAFQAVMRRDEDTQPRNRQSLCTPRVQERRSAVARGTDDATNASTARDSRETVLPLSQ